MLPTLHPGDQVLIHPGAYRYTPPQVGDIVLARHPHHRKLYLVKRIQSAVDHSYFLIGDNVLESTDSQVFHSISLDHILGEVTCLF